MYMQENIGHAMKGCDTMHVALNREGDTLTACLNGELDHHTAAEMRQQIDAAALAGRCRLLRLDFAGITFMDSSGIGLIMGRYRLMQSMGGSLRLQGTGQRLERMIHLAGLDKLPIWNTQEGKD